jgi:putative ABC transport system substrate-binding protein
MFIRSAEQATRKIAIEVVTVPVHTSDEIEAAMAKLGRQPGSGLIFPPDTFTTRHHKLIVELAADNRLPAIYAFRYFAVAGGLASYGPDVVDQFRRAGKYVDRVLRGEKAADLPVQQPTKFEFVVNLKTAKALGITVPSSRHAHPLHSTIEGAHCAGSWIWLSLEGTSSAALSRSRVKNEAA